MSLVISTIFYYHQYHLMIPPFLIDVLSQRLLPAPKENKRMMRNIQLSARLLARRAESRPRVESRSLGKGLPRPSVSRNPGNAYLGYWPAGWREGAPRKAYPG